MVLVSLLVDQLSSLFLSFFGRPKKICSVSGNFWSGSDFFWSTKFLFGTPKFLFSIPKNQSLTKKNSETDQKIFVCSLSGQFFFGQPKKLRNRLDNWSTKRLTKSTWTPLMYYNICSVKKDTKRSSNTVLCVVSFFTEQTLHIQLEYHFRFSSFHQKFSIMSISIRSK